MRTWVVGVLIVTLVGPAPLLVAQPPPPKTVEMIEIDGAKTPELIPEHVTWSTGFRVLTHIKTQNVTPALDSLGLSEKDAALTFAEAARQKDRDQTCADRTGRLMEPMRGVAPMKVETAVRPSILECRWAVLYAQERLLPKLSPEGQVTLTNWMLNQRRTIKSTMPKGLEEFYRQPR